MTQPASPDRDDDDREDDRDEEQSFARPALPAPKAAGGSPLAIYKPGQGEYVRWSSAAGAGLLAGCFAWFLHDQLAGLSESVQMLVPVVALVALAVLIFRFVGQSPRVVDFMIATEGELKKVNWSTRREILGNTRVVIFLIVVVGFILFLVDVGFIGLFESIGVLRLGLLKSMFSSTLGG